MLCSDPASEAEAILGSRNFGSLNKQDRKGNGTPLQYSCLENPMNGGAW